LKEISAFVFIPPVIARLGGDEFVSFKSGFIEWVINIAVDESQSRLKW